MNNFDPNAAISTPAFVPGTPTWVQDIIAKAADKHGVPSMLLSALLKQESGFNINAQSPVGALGIAQFMPGTAKGRGVDPLDPVSAINGAAKYLSEGLQKYGGDAKKALAAYNAGFGAVDKWGGIPPYAETQRYVKNILAMAGEPHDSANGPVLDIIAQAKKQSQQPLNQSVVAATAQSQPAQPKYSDNQWLNDQISQVYQNQPPQQAPQEQPQPAPVSRPVQPVGQMPTAPQAPQGGNSLAYQSFAVPEANIGGGNAANPGATAIPMPNIGGRKA